MSLQERRIEVFAEITCPFTHVGLRRLAEERTRRGVADPRLVVRAWPLELINGDPLDPGHVVQEIDALQRSVAPDLFQGFDASRFPSTSIAAFGLAAAAYRVSDTAGEQVSLAIRAAVFEQGRDLTDHAVLRDIGAEHGVEPLDAEAARAAVDADWGEGRDRGVQGSPQFFIEANSWFCPNLTIRHNADGFSISQRDDVLAEFYAAVFDRAI